MLCRFLIFAKAFALAWTSVVVGLSAEALRIDVPARATPIDFSAEIVPLLQANCLACHNAKKSEGGLSLETLSSIVRGGEQGPAVVPGKSAESLLLAVAAHQNDTIMPPPDNIVGAKPFTSSQLGLLKLWIDQGATGKETALREIRWQAPPSSYQPAFAVAVTPDGQFGVGSRGRSLCVYHLPTGKAAGTLVDPALASSGVSSGAAHHDIVRCLAFDATGELLASGGFREVKLWRRPRIARTTEFAHDSPIRSLGTSADGQRVATGDQRGQIRIWQTGAAQSIHSFKAHDAPVTGIALAADGLLISCSLDKSIKAWRSDAAPAGKAIELPSPITALAVIDQGHKLITGDERGTVLVWDAAAVFKMETEPAKPLAEIKAHGTAITSLAAVPGRQEEFITGAADNLVRRWNATSSKQLAEFKHDAPVVAVAVDETGKRIAAASDGTIKVWDESGKPVTQISGDPRAAAQVAKIDADITFTKAVISRSDNDLKSYEGLIRGAMVNAESVKKAEEELEKAKKTRDEKKTALEKVKGDGDKADKTKLDAAEKALATAETAVIVAGTVIERAKGVAERTAQRLADAQAELAAQKERLQKQEGARTEALAAAKAANPNVLSLAFSPADPLRLAVGCGDGAVHVYDIDSGTLAQSLFEHRGAVQAIDFSPAGMLLTGSADARVVSWTVPTQWRLERVIGGLNRPDVLVDRVLSVDFSRDGKWLATGSGVPSRFGEVKIFNVADGQPVRELTGAHTETVFAVRFSPDGNSLATAAGDRLVKVFDVNSGKESQRFAGHTGHVLGLGWKADGKFLASGGADNVIKLWNVDSGLPARTMKGGIFGNRTYKNPVTGVSFIGESEELIAVSGDGTVRLHRASSDHEIMTFTGSKGYQFSTATTPDGKAVLVGDGAGTLRLWSGHQPQPKFSLSP